LKLRTGLYPPLGRAAPVLKIVFPAPGHPIGAERVNFARDLPEQSQDYIPKPPEPASRRCAFLLLPKGFET